MKLWRILASHKDDSFTLTDWEDMTYAMDGHTLLSYARDERLLGADFGLATSGLALQEQYTGPHGIYLERLGPVPVEEPLPKLERDPDCTNALICPHCGPAIDEEFIYVEPIDLYYHISVGANGELVREDRSHHDDVGDGAFRLFHEPCGTYLDPNSVEAY